MKKTKPGGTLRVGGAANRKENVLSMANPKNCHLGNGELIEGALKSMAPFPGHLGKEHCSKEPTVEGSRAREPSQVPRKMADSLVSDRVSTNSSNTERGSLHAL